MSTQKVTVCVCTPEKNFQETISQVQLRSFLSRRRNIGDTFLGTEIGLDESTYRITGASSDSGQPYCRLILGDRPKRVLLRRGYLLRRKEKGLRLKRTLFPRQLTERISQISLVRL